MRTQVVAACLLMIASMPAPTVLAEDEGKCKSWEDDDGGKIKQPLFNGASVNCERPCDANSTLGIHVYSHDSSGRNTASVSGEFLCGGESASCSNPKGQCSANSVGVTSRADNAGDCSAVSDEFWTSKLEVTCTSLVIDPEPYCPITAPIEVCVDPLPDIVGGTETPGRLSSITMKWDPITEAATGSVCHKGSCSPFIPWVLDGVISSGSL